jgi:hypothetical protein
VQRTGADRVRLRVLPRRDLVVVCVRFPHPLRLHNTPARRQHHTVCALPLLKRYSPLLKCPLPCRLGALRCLGDSSPQRGARMRREACVHQHHTAGVSSFCFTQSFTHDKAVWRTQVNKILKQPFMIQVYESCSDEHTFLSYLGGAVGSQHPHIAASIREHFTTFSNFIHCHMRHLLYLPTRSTVPSPETHEDDAASTSSIVQTIEETTQFLCANSSDDAHSKPFAIVPQVCAHALSSDASSPFPCLS